MAAKSAMKLEDRWLLEMAGALALLVEPSGLLAEKKLRWLTETRELVKALRDQVVKDMPAAEHAYEERAAVIGPMETLLLDIGRKIAVAEPDGNGPNSTEADSDSADSAKNDAEAEATGTAGDADVDGTERADVGKAELETVEGRSEMKAGSGSLARNNNDPDSTTAGNLPPRAALVRQARDADRKPAVLCLYCRDPSDLHPICKCPYFQALSPARRLAMMSKLKCCFNCYSQLHAVAKCPEGGRCLRCSSKHHTNFHGLL